MNIKPEQAVNSFIAICTAFGLLAGCVGLGAGLIFLTVAQAIGVGILATGCGALFSMVLGARKIIKAMIKAMDEMGSKANHDQQG